MNKMTKSLLIVSILSNAAMAEVFIGLDLLPSGTLKQTYSGDYTGSAETGISGYRLKVGAGELGDSLWQFYYASKSADTEIMVSKQVNEIGVDYIPSWKIENNFYVNGKFGLNYGSTEADQRLYDSSSWGYVGLRAGINVSYLLNDRIEFIGGYDFNIQRWQNITDGYSTLETSGSDNGIFVGVNYYFGTADKSSVNVPSDDSSGENK